MENKMKKIRNYTLAAGLALFIGQYAQNIDYRNLTKLPETEESSLIDRINPLDQLGKIPKAAAYGLYGTLISAGSYSSNDKLPRIISVPRKIANGLVSTVLDTTLNAAMWIPSEAYQAITGKNLKDPAIPFTQETTPLNIAYTPK